MQAKLDPDKITEDLIAAARWLQVHPESSGKVGVVGFCFGGALSMTLAIRLPDVINAAVPFYGRQPAAGDVAKIKAPLIIHNGSLDERVLAGAPAFVEAM